jgi:adenylosuccinate lyase
MEVYPESVRRENERYLPFLLSTTFLMEALKRGAGRESAHAAIKEHALAAARALRDGSSAENDFLDRLAADPRAGFSREELEGLLAEGRSRTGAARAQVDLFVRQAREAAASCPGADAYRPGTIL